MVLGTGDGTHLVHNAGILQSGPCFTLLHGGSASAPDGRGSAAELTTPHERWFWPLGSALATDGTLRVFLAEMHERGCHLPQPHRARRDVDGRRSTRSRSPRSICARRRTDAPRCTAGRSPPIATRRTCSPSATASSGSASSATTRAPPRSAWPASGAATSTTAALLGRPRPGWPIRLAPSTSRRPPGRTARPGRQPDADHVRPRSLDRRHQGGRLVGLDHVPRPGRRARPGRGRRPRDDARRHRSATPTRSTRTSPASSPCTGARSSSGSATTAGTVAPRRTTARRSSPCRWRRGTARRLSAGQLGALSG